MINQVTHEGGWKRNFNLALLTMTYLLSTTTRKFHNIATISGRTFTALTSLSMIHHVSATTVNLQDGLVAYYPFNGNANDESGNQLHGTVYGATLTTDRFGYANSAYNFDGISNYIKIGDPVPPLLQIQNSITLASWVYVTSIPYELGLIIGCQYDAYISGVAMHLDGRLNSNDLVAPSGHIHFQIADGKRESYGGGWHHSNANGIVPVNQWVFIVATRNAREDPKVYYNGILQPVNAASWAWDGTISYNQAMYAMGRQKDLGRL